MRRVLLLLSLLVMGADAHAAIARAPVEITGEAKVGTVHRGACRGANVEVGGQTVWCGYGAADVVTEVAWARGGHAIAFATRSRGGRFTLRVAVLRGRFEGTLISWPLAVTGRPGEPLSVMWLGPDRVGIGRNAVRPLLVASWRLRNT